MMELVNVDLTNTAFENEEVFTPSVPAVIAEETTPETPENTPGTTNVSSNPVEDIQQEVEKAIRAPKHVGLLSIKSANAWIEDSIKTPDPKMFFHGLIVQYENTVIFASSNVGKSILAIQIAEDIARTEKIMYVDLELSAKQFQMRYSDSDTGEIHVFPANFSRAEIDPELIVWRTWNKRFLTRLKKPPDKAPTSS